MLRRFSEPATEIIMPSHFPENSCIFPTESLPAQVPLAERPFPDGVGQRLEDAPAGFFRDQLVLRITTWNAGGPRQGLDITKIANTSDIFIMQEANEQHERALSNLGYVTHFNHNQQLLIAGDHQIVSSFYELSCNHFSMNGTTDMVWTAVVDVNLTRIIGNNTSTRVMSLHAGNTHVKHKKSVVLANQIIYEGHRHKVDMWVGDFNQLVYTNANRPNPWREGLKHLYMHCNARSPSYRFFHSHYGIKWSVKECCGFWIPPWSPLFTSTRN